MWVQCWPQKARNGFSCTGKESRGEGKVPAGTFLMDPGPSGDAAAGMGQTGSLLQDGLGLHDGW